MTQINWSWLYGASQGQECPYCGIPVYPVPANVESHEFWCDARPGSWIHPTYGVRP